MPAPPPKRLFITGTDTGVGKTILTALLTRCLRREGRAVAALKPFASGGRDDARALHRELAGALSLDEINPWHFRAALTPLVAARRVHQTIPLADVLRHLRRMARRFEWTLIEGAGGVLSPLGEGYAARELIVRLRAEPWIVCPNRLGALNQTLMALAALPSAARIGARIVLMSGAVPDPAARSNLELLAEMLGRERVLALPHLGPEPLSGREAPAVTRSLRAFLKASDRPSGPSGPRSRSRA